MKGIILAGGTGSRLYPITKGVSKQLLPIYDKPMIYYPISVLMNSGIRDILIISTPNDLPNYKTLLGTGGDIGVNFYYKVQQKPEGLAQAFIIGKDFIGEDSVCLVLGDNIFYGNGFNDLIMDAKLNLEKTNQAYIFGYRVRDPQRYGVVQFDKNQKVISIEEKPKNPKSNYAVIGIYFYPNDVIKKATKVKPSSRGELEISTLNQMYLNENRLNVNLMMRGYTWLDTGTHDSLSEASEVVKIIEKRKGLKVACLEEIAFRKKYISYHQAFKIGTELSNTEYGKYILQIIEELNQK